MVKKITAIIITIIAVSVFSVACFAADTELYLSQLIMAEPGETVEVEVMLENNPGIVSANLKLEFEEGLTLVGAENGDTFSTLTYVPPKRLSSGGEITSNCQFAWTGFDIEDEDICDGTILTLFFKVSEEAEDGDYFEINISSDTGDVIDRDLNSVILSAQTYVDVHEYEHTHSYTSAVTKKPTCIKTGVKTYTCSCGDSYTETIKATGHKETTLKAVSATCTKTGLTAGKKCSVCGTINASQRVIAKTAHKEIAVAGKSATYTSTGLTAGKKCSVCGKITVAQKTIAKLTLGKVDGLKAKKVKVAKSSEITLAWNAVTGAKGYEIYQQNGSSWKKIKTTSGTSYTVKKLKSNKTYKFKVRAVVDDIKGKYSSTLKVETIPSTATLKLKAGKKQLTASWSKVSDISGYEVQYSTSKKFTKKTTKTVKVKKSSKKTTIKKLTKGKKYYVRIRTYKTVNGKKIYSDWSKVKSVKVK